MALHVNFVDATQTPSPEPNVSTLEKKSEDALLNEVFSAVHLMNVKFTDSAIRNTKDCSETAAADDSDTSRLETDALVALDTVLNNAGVASFSSSGSLSPAETEENDDNNNNKTHNSYYQSDNYDSNFSTIRNATIDTVIDKDHTTMISEINRIKDDSKVVNASNTVINVDTSPANGYSDERNITSILLSDNNRTSEGMNKNETLLRDSSSNMDEEAYCWRQKHRNSIPLYEESVETSAVLRAQLDCATSVGEESGIVYFRLEFKFYDIDDDIEEFVVGGEAKAPNEDEKVLILFGPKGSGKTSLLTTLINHLYDVRQQHNFRLCIDDPRQIQNTDGLTKYVFNNTIYPFRIIVVDTPGVPDDIHTVGHSYSRTSSIIRKWFQSQLKVNGAFRLDAILFVVKDECAAIGETMVEELNRVKEMFGDNLKMNLLPIITFSAMLTPSAKIINSLLKAHVDFLTFYTVQNDSVLPLRKNGNALRHLLHFKHTNVSLEKLFHYLDYVVQPMLAVLRKRNTYAKH